MDELTLETLTSLVTQFEAATEEEQKEILKNFQNTSSDKNYKTQKSFMDKVKDFFD